jgi:hypothetical protein
VSNVTRFVYLTTAGSAVLWLACSVTTAHGQPPPGGVDYGRKPTVSPYINLVRTGTSPGINYYGIVRPEIVFRSSLTQLQGEQMTLATQQQELTAYTALPATGHVSGFQTQSKYFMSGGGIVQSAPAVRPVGITPKKAPGRQ